MKILREIRRATSLAVCVHSGSSKVMDQVSVTAASGLQSRMEALDMVANNLANTTTGGFKLDREFYSLFTAAESEGDGSATKLPLIQKQWTDFSQGVLAPTGNPLDVALSGKGFFAVNGPAGPLYTRNGSFQLSSSGQLTTSEGYAVRDVNGQPIQTQSQDPHGDRRGRIDHAGRAGCRAIAGREF